MGGSVAGMHKTIMPLTCGHTPPNHCPQQQQLLQQHRPIANYPPGGTAWQQPTPPAQFNRMPPASSTYRQQTTMAMPVYHPGQGMMITSSTNHTNDHCTINIRKTSAALPCASSQHCVDIGGALFLTTNTSIYQCTTTLAHIQNQIHSTWEVQV
jgi:hypothetical protein